MIKFYDASLGNIFNVQLYNEIDLIGVILRKFKLKKILNDPFLYYLYICENNLNSSFNYVKDGGI